MAGAPGPAGPSPNPVSLWKLAKDMMQAETRPRRSKLGTQRSKRDKLGRSSAGQEAKKKATWLLSQRATARMRVKGDVCVLVSLHC